MSRTRDRVQEQGPRLFVVFASGPERAEVISSLPSSVTVVGDVELRDVVSAQIAMRSLEVSDEIDTIRREIASVVEHRASLEEIHAGLVATRSQTLDAADWCERQPGQEAEDAVRIAAADETLESHSRAVREANRRLERVLEQRAAAEAALEEARAELETLGAVGDAEPDVRRHMEEASRRLHEVAAAHQRCLAEAARLHGEVQRLEAVAGVGNEGTRSFDDDPLQAMRAAVSARFAEVDGTVTVIDPDALAAARDEAARADSEAERLGQEAARARASVASLERELAVRIDASDSRAERHRAALELESQVSAVERQLGAAERSARDVVDEATREMSRAELSLERLRTEARGRRDRLRQLAALVPDALRPGDEEDPVAHAAVIARGLRAHAEAMQPDVDHAVGAIERDGARISALESQVEERRADIGVVSPRDRSNAVARLSDGGLAVVFDESIASVDAEDEGAVTCVDLLAAETETPIIVLTSDPSIVSWAIEQPADRAAVTSVVNLLEIGAALADQSTTRQ